MEGCGMEGCGVVGWYVGWRDVGGGGLFGLLKFKISVRHYYGDIIDRQKPGTQLLTLYVQTILTLFVKISF